MNTSFARFVAYAAGIGSVAEEGIALERDPLATIFMTMRCQPLLLSCAAPNVRFSHHVLIVVRKASCRGEYLAERSERTTGPA
jgi:hypothetical protein